MEYHGFVRCMEYLLGTGLLIKTFVSDRHSGNAKHRREKLTTIKHYLDISRRVCYQNSKLYLLTIGLLCSILRYIVILSSRL